MRYSATYSPDDNKLRLYATSRLDAETYAKVKAAGFRWAPKQELFVAPMWTPAREDLLIELAGEIDDEDKSLVERAEERADRFDNYSDKRAADADSARKAVDRIADGIPFGQPILVGHHSEKHARRDAAKIENGMRKAVKMWQTSKYWTSRAEGALRHAKYKELPGVRARRIKTLGAEKRKCERSLIQCKQGQAKWIAGDITAHDVHFYLRSSYAFDLCREFEAGTVSDLDVIERKRKAYENAITSNDRWITHYENRLLYENALLEEAGASDLLKPKPRRELMPLLNYRAAGGAITTENQWDRGRQITYPQVEMTKAEYARINGDYRGARLGPDKRHRIRTAMIKHSLVSVFLTDSKVHPQPAATEAAPTQAPELPERRLFAFKPKVDDPRDTEFSAMNASLKAGVTVVTAPQLFPTPRDIAEQAVALAGIETTHRVLEPSAGTGALLDAIYKEAGAQVVAVEINPALAGRLEAVNSAVVCGDFLQCTAEALWGMFDRIVMNPPFERGADIAHIKHAMGFLKPGGRLVAICANGPRQREQLMPMASEWIDLPAGSFKEQGTGVNTAMLVIDA